MKRYPKKRAVSIVLGLLLIIGCFLGCTKEEVKGQFQKVVGDVGSGSDGFQFGGIVTDTPPNEQTKDLFRSISFQRAICTMDWSLKTVVLFRRKQKTVN